jgi:hypothetical protein
MSIECQLLGSQPQPTFHLVNISIGQTTKFEGQYTVFNRIENICELLDQISNREYQVQEWSGENPDFASPDELLNILITDYRLRETISEVYVDEIPKILELVDCIYDKAKNISATNIPVGVFDSNRDMAEATVNDPRWKSIMHISKHLSEMLRKTIN